MTNFIKDNTALGAAKSNFQVRASIPAGQKVAATDWNEVRQALLDIQSYLRGGVASTSVPPADLPIQVTSTVVGSSTHGRLVLPSNVTGKAPYVLDTFHYTSLGTEGPVGSFAYNQLANGNLYQAGENGLGYFIEGDFNDGVKRSMEAYLQYISADTLVTKRGFFFQFNRATNALESSFIMGSDATGLNLVNESSVAAMNVKVNGTQVFCTAAGVIFQVTTSGSTRTADQTLHGLSSTVGFDTTAGVRTNNALTINNSASRSAGANNLLNQGLVIDVLNGQVNRAILTERGDNIFNNSGGSSTFVRDVAVQGNFTAGDGATDVHSVVGTMGLTSNPSALAADSVALNTARAGTFDATAAARTSTGLVVGVSSTRSTGANNLNNRGILINITGGQTNTALLVDRGDTILGVTSGTTKIVGNVGFYNTNPIAKPAASGSRGGNAALASLLTALANLGLITDSTTA